MVTVGSIAKVDGAGTATTFGVTAAPAHIKPSTGISTEAVSVADARISAAGKIKSASAAVIDAATALAQAETWTATRATSDQDSLVEATSCPAAQLGSHDVTINALATAQITSSAPLSSLATVIGIGTLHIELGDWNTSLTAFSTNPNWPKASVNLSPKDTSLERVRDKINAAGVGVLAAVVSDATGCRLVLRSTATGSSTGFRIKAEADGQDAHSAASTQLAALEFDPSSVQGAGRGLTGMTLDIRAQDADVLIDGRHMRSAGNVIDDAKSGLMLTLRSHDAVGKTVLVNVMRDHDAVMREVLALVSSYNELGDRVQLRAPSVSQMDAEARTAYNLQTTMPSLLNRRVEPSGLCPSDVGLTMDGSGRLMLEVDRLQQALATIPDQVRTTLGASGLSGVLLRGAEPQPANRDDTSSAGVGFRQRLLDQYTREFSPPDAGKYEARPHTSSIST